ncbi:MAG: uroporphyrinogen-III synthase [Ignavibacteriales bacterium]|nr:uroporphyrinogen-III synthase [Ignavibacteriales bacterium]MCB9209202.1 uroporphyrinogen-III synthase [Ignavibacteriales bacterium]MCB9219548.1 uroporphyrinogen-III synthase [Ignavibacteriales bacterium]
MEKVLENINIVLTRAKDQSVESIKSLEELGANVISFPTIKIVEITNTELLDKTIKNISEFNTIIFTSENAVKYFLKKIDDLNVNFEQKDFFVISIGSKTSQVCEENNILTNLQPSKATSDVLIKELKGIDLSNKKIIIPCSKLTKQDQYKELGNLAEKLVIIPIYDNVVNDVINLETEIKQINSSNIDLFIFTSPSTFNGFLEIMKIENPKDYFADKKVAVIGPVTEKALNDFDIKPDIIPNDFSMNHLIETIKKYYSEKSFVN